MNPEKQLRAALQPGEKLLWIGLPSRRRFRSEMAAHFLFGLIALLSAAILLSINAWSLWQKNLATSEMGGQLLAAGASTFFMGLGIYSYCAPYMIGSRLNEVAYAITDRRGLVLTSPHTYWNPVPPLNDGETLSEFSPSQLQAYKKQWRDFGRTDLILHEEYQRAARGRGEWIRYGFLGLENPDEAEQIIRKYFHTQQPEKTFATNGSEESL